jgi:natural product precursor
MVKKKVKKLMLNKESLVRLDSSDLRAVVGGFTLNCTNSDFCTESCGCTTHNSSCC